MAVRRFASALLPPPLVTELIVDVRAWCVTETDAGAGAGCVSGMYGEGNATLVPICLFDPEPEPEPETCGCGESTTTRPRVGVRGENKGRWSGSIEACLIVLPGVNLAGSEEMVCWTASFSLLSFPGVGGVVVEMTGLMSTLNDSPIRIVSLCSTSAVKSTLTSVG